MVHTGTGSPGKAKKPVKKRKPWSDSDGSAGEISDISDSDMGDSFVAPARDRGPRRAAGEWRYLTKQSLCFFLSLKPV